MKALQLAPELLFQLRKGSAVSRGIPQQHAIAVFQRQDCQVVREDALRIRKQIAAQSVQGRLARMGQRLHEVGQMVTLEPEPADPEVDLGQPDENVLV